MRRPSKHFRTVPFGRCPADASPSSNQRSSEFLRPVLPKARSSPVVEARVVLLPSLALGHCVESRGLGPEAAGDLEAERHEDPAVGEILVLTKTLTPSSIGSFPFLLRRCKLPRVVIVAPASSEIQGDGVLAWCCCVGRDK